MNTQTKFRTAALVGGACAALFALTACGADSETDEGSGAQDDAAETTAVVEEATGPEGPEDVIVDFLDNGVEDLIVSIVVDQDFNAAAEAAEPYFCAETVAEIRTTGETFDVMSEEDRAAAMEQFGQLESGSFEVDYEILGSTEDGETATVEAEVTSPNPLTGETETLTNEFPMVKEDGRWQMCEAFF